MIPPRTEYQIFFNYYNEKMEIKTMIHELNRRSEILF